MQLDAEPVQPPWVRMRPQPAQRRAASQGLPRLAVPEQEQVLLPVPRPPEPLPERQVQPVWWQVPGPALQPC